MKTSSLQLDPPCRADARALPCNLAELRRNLGMIPADRIVCDPRPGTAVKDDVTWMHDHAGRVCELVDGTLVEKAMGARESLLAADLIFEIKLYLRSHDLGEVLGEAAFLELMPALVRAADVSFISWERMPNQEFPEEPIPAIVPDLAVEIFSKSNTKAEMKRKRREYFRSGVRLVWIVYPKEEMVEVYTAPNRKRQLTIAETLDGGDVLPGFKLPLARLFRPRRKK